MQGGYEHGQLEAIPGRRCTHTIMMCVSLGFLLLQAAQLFDGPDKVLIVHLLSTATVERKGEKNQVTTFTNGQSALRLRTWRGFVHDVAWSMALVNAFDIVLDYIRESAERKAALADPTKYTIANCTMWALANVRHGGVMRFSRRALTPPGPKRLKSRDGVLSLCAGRRRPQTQCRSGHCIQRCRPMFQEGW